MSIGTRLYRDNGAVGALLDEYERALDELKIIITNVSSADLTRIVDAETKDEDCRSIQTILTHVVSAGYNYVVEIRRHLGEDVPYRNKKLLESIPLYQTALNEMFDFNLKLFEDLPELELVEKNPDKKIKVRWGQKFDVEQLIEHAIVHILRHRRQIERFVLKLK